MPGKLIVLLLWMALGVAGAMYSQSWITAGIQALLLVGVASGKEGARKLLIMLYILGAGVGGTGLFLDAAMNSAYSSRPERMLIPLILGLFVVLPNLFGIWVLTRKDVQWWMYQRAMGGAAPSSPNPPP